VRPGSPADAAAIEVGTRVLGVDGRVVQSLDQFHAHLASRLPGDTITLQVLRPHSDDISAHAAESATAHASVHVKLIVGASSVSAEHVATLRSAAASLIHAPSVRCASSGSMAECRQARPFRCAGRSPSPRATTGARRERAEIRTCKQQGTNGAAMLAVHTGASCAVTIV
jgi:hypothetical protein